MKYDANIANKTLFDRLVVCFLRDQVDDYIEDAFRVKEFHGYFIPWHFLFGAKSRDILAGFM